MSIGTLKPSKAELEKANEVLKKAKAIKRKVVRLKQGDCIEYRNMLKEVEKQKDKRSKLGNPIKRAVNKGFIVNIYLGGNKSVYLGKFPTRQIAEKAKRIAIELRDEHDGDNAVFRDLIKSKL